MKRVFSGMIFSPRSVKALLTLLFLVFMAGGLKAQNEDIHFGVRGGIGMSTLRGMENNGLRLGITAGAFGQYLLNENNSLQAELYYSSGGQQSEKWTENSGDQVKVYSKYGLHYINLPIIYQYYFPAILGLEAGLNFRYCMAGSLQTKIGNGSWQSQSFLSSDYNSFDMGLLLGIYTDHLIPHDNFFVSLRVYFGFINVLTNEGGNKNLSVQACVGYTLF